MKTIGVLTAMSVEYRQLASIMTDAHEEIDGIQKYLIGNIGKHRIVLVECGIGKVNSAVGCTLLIQRYQPDKIISTGVAGGVDMSINVMDVVVSTSQVYHDVWCGPGNAWGQVQGLPEQYQSNTEMLSVAESLKTQTKIIPGLICSGDMFITKHEEQLRIKELFPEAMAVDMESCSIAQVCYKFNIPFISFRIISDTPGEKNNIIQYENFWKTMADTSFSVTKEFILAL